jgi:integrase/recombinase XerD
MGRPTSKVSKVEVAGPLAPFAAGFKARLEQLGYAPLSAVNSMRLMVYLSRWLEASELTSADLTTDRVEQYFRERRAAGYAGSRSSRSMTALLEVLGSAGVRVRPHLQSGVRADVQRSRRVVAVVV